jgi:hypothetical protein
MLNGDISVLESQIRELQARLSPLQQERDNHASYISPFRRLPTDILTDILHICLDNGVKLKILTAICGTIRDNILTTTTFWNRVRMGRPRRWTIVTDVSEIFCWGDPIELISSKEKKVDRDLTVERLDVVLERAGSMPLEIWIDRINDENQVQMLELISSRNCSIRSMTVREEEPISKELPEQAMMNLNMNAFKELCLIETSQHQAKRIMDLATRSREDSMKIKIHIGRMDLVPIFQHELFQRIVELDTSNRPSSLQ